MPSFVWSALVVAAVHLASAQENNALYTPLEGNAVADASSLDLDRRSMVGHLAPATPQGLAQAESLYQVGAHSGSTAFLTITSGGLRNDVPQGSRVTGLTEDNLSVQAFVYKGDGQLGGSSLFVRYESVPIFANVPKCRPRATPTPDLDGCFARNGTIMINLKDSYTYQYLLETQNKPTLSFEKLSISVGDSLSDCLLRGQCNYLYMAMYKDYYGVLEYANVWMMSAFRGQNTSFETYGNMDFSSSAIGSVVGRGTAILIGLLTLNTWMRVVQALYEAADFCDSQRWDDAVAFYVGATQLENPSEEGYMLYELAQVQCQAFGTCLENEGGIAKVNQDILREFRNGQSLVGSFQCENGSLDMIVTKIIQLMTIPLVQGLLSSMLELNEFGPRDTIKGRVLAYGAALLPILDYCNPENAELIYSNLPVDDGPMGSFIVVKNALEASYDCMGITCEDVGGRIDFANPGQYWMGAEPCSVSPPVPSDPDDNDTSNRPAFRPGGRPSNGETDASDDPDRPAFRPGGRPSSGGTDDPDDPDRPAFRPGGRPSSGSGLNFQVTKEEADFAIGVVIAVGGIGFLSFIVLCVMYYDYITKQSKAGGANKEVKEGDGLVSSGDLTLEEQSHPAVNRPLPELS